MADMSSQCTCAKDKEMTCIVHPTMRSLKIYIAEIKAEKARLREALERLVSVASQCDSWEFFPSVELDLAETALGASDE